MRVHLHNIVSTAIERGLITGYQQITSPQFKGSADDAIDCLYSHVWDNLGDLVDFKEEDDSSSKPIPKQIGFTSAVSSISEATETEDSDETPSDLWRKRHASSTKISRKRG